MKEKVLSVFIDESGDSGQYNLSSPNYYVAMVLNNQEIYIFYPLIKLLFTMTMVR